MNEVSRHVTHDDLWIVYEGKVIFKLIFKLKYLLFWVCNMTPYLKMHPGGLAMMRQAGGVNLKYLN